MTIIIKTKMLGMSMAVAYLTAGDARRIQKKLWTISKKSPVRTQELHCKPDFAIIMVLALRKIWKRH